MKNSFVVVLIVLILVGCGNNTYEQDYFLAAAPVEVIDPVHQQDLINLEAPDEDEEQEQVHIELSEALKKKIEITEEPEFETRTKVPKEVVTIKKDPVVVTPEVIKPEVVKKEELVVNKEPVTKKEVKEEPVKEKKEDKKDIRTSYEGRASVYYLPVLDEKRSCAAEKRVHMRDPQGKILAQLCRNEILNCALQGSCYFLTSKDIRLFAYSGHVAVKLPKSDKIIKEPRFKINHDLDDCPFGMGAGKTCLDPYRSVAADPKFHKRGDVVYIPKLDGQVLPNGEKHDGHMIVRDTGGAILGEGRFDFFIGFDDYRDHLFTQLNLSDKNKNFFTYYKVPDDEAQMIRKSRAFPSVPEAGKITTLSVLKDQKKSEMAQNKTSTK